MTNSSEIILIDDEADIRAAYAQAFELAGLKVRTFDRAEPALEAVGSQFDGIILSDIRMPGMDGMSLLSRLRRIDPELPVILVTGHADLPLAVKAMREGAYDFLEKPAGAAMLVAVARRALGYRALVLENRRLRMGGTGPELAEARLPGRTAQIEAARSQLAAVARSNMDVLIVGETGTGKGVAAQLVHDLGERAGKPFVTVDCSALSPDRIDSDLFGHEAGAFPGALRPRSGKLEHGRGGTIVLDEIQSLSLEMQAKLLQVVETRTATRLGSHDPFALDARFIATSKVALDAEVEAGRFRADLLYRFHAVSVTLPRLAERRDDIPSLFMHLVREAATRQGIEAPRVSSATMADLASRDWPGNIRELRNVAERYVLGIGQPDSAQQSPGMRLADQVDAFERSVIAGALVATEGSLRATYEVLGISRKTLYEKMQKHRLDRHDFLPDEAAKGGADED